MAGICTSSYPIKKVGTFHTHTQSMRRFSIKTGTGLGNTHGTNLFAIFTHET